MGDELTFLSLPCPLFDFKAVSIPLVYSTALFNIYFPVYIDPSLPLPEVKRVFRTMVRRSKRIRLPVFFTSIHSSIFLSNNNRL